MIPITRPFTLDISKPGQQAVQYVRKGDTRIYCYLVSLVDGALPISVASTDTVVLACTKSDGTVLTLHGLPENGRAKVYLPSQANTADGIVRCQLQIIGEDGSDLYSPSFDIVVEDCVLAEDVIASSSDFSALSTLYQQIRGLVDRAAYTIVGVPYASVEALHAAVPNPYPFSMYAVGEEPPYTVYRKTDDDSVGYHGWDSMGQIPQGITGQRGSKFYDGEAITGTEADPTAYDTGIIGAVIGDVYRYIGTDAANKGNEYICVNGGDDDVALWAYSRNVLGPENVKSIDSIEPGDDGNIELNALRLVDMDITDEKKAIARSNIGAMDASKVGKKTSITLNKDAWSFLETDPIALTGEWRQTILDPTNLSILSPDCLAIVYGANDSAASILSVNEIKMYEAQNPSAEFRARTKPSVDVEISLIAIPIDAGIGVQIISSFQPSSEIRYTSMSLTSAEKNIARENIDSASGTAFLEKTGYGIYIGLRVTPQTVADMTVKVTAGTGFTPDGKRRIGLNQSSIAIDTHDATYGRIDIIYFQYNETTGYGEAKYTAGTPAEIPAAPSLPSNCLLLACINVSTDTTAITDAEIDTDDVLYINGDKWVTVWTNPGTDPFPGQVIAIDLSEYKRIKVEATYVDLSSGGEIPSAEANIGDTGTSYLLASASTGDGYIRDRRFTATKTGVDFEDARKFTIATNTATTDNNYLLPRKIRARKNK